MKFKTKANFYFYQLIKRGKREKEKRKKNMDINFFSSYN